MLNNESYLWDKKYQKSRKYDNIEDLFRFCTDNPTLKSIFPHISNRKNFRILEIGSGTGELISYLKFHSEKIEAHGLDFSSESIRKSRETTKLFDLNVDFILGDIKNMPFAENYFDIVFGDQVIGHIDNVDEALEEIYRVTQKNGIVAFSIGNAIRPDGWYLHTKLSKNHEGYKQKNMFPWILNSHVKKIGFKPIKFYADMPVLFRTFSSIKSLLFGNNNKVQKEYKNRIEEKNDNKTTSVKKKIFRKFYNLLDNNFPFWLKITVGIVARK